MDDKDARRDKLLRQDWSETWNSLPDAPPLVLDYALYTLVIRTDRQHDEVKLEDEDAIREAVSAAERACADKLPEGFKVTVIDG